MTLCLAPPCTLPSHFTRITQNQPWGCHIYKLPCIVSIFFIFSCSIGDKYAVSVGRLPSGLNPWEVFNSRRKMLAVFEKGIGKPPEELGLPSTGLQSSKTRQEIAEMLRVGWPEVTMYSLSNGNFLALSHEDENPTHPR